MKRQYSWPASHSSPHDLSSPNKLTSQQAKLPRKQAQPANTPSNFNRSLPTQSDTMRRQPPEVAVLLLALASLGLLRRLESRPVSQSSRPTSDEPRAAISAAEEGALAYLQRYGYMVQSSNSATNKLISEDSFSAAISSFQRFANLPETGQVDEQTWKFMQLPRCGNTDKSLPHQPANQTNSIKTNTLFLATHLLVPMQPNHRQVRKKRYALQGSKWRRQELTYRISQYPTRFNGRRHDVDSQIEKAFAIWSQVAPIDFVVKREGRVHIDIRFASGDHGDGDAFDGPGNTLAHAYFPQYGGDAHFDDQEFWTIDSYAGTNIFQVAAHELGHSLGLGHSNVREALMAPFYQKYKPNFRLHMDDVLAIQALYGEKSLTDTMGLAGASQQPTSTPSTTSSSTSIQPPARHKPSGLAPRSDPREMNEDEANSLPDLAANGISPPVQPANEPEAGQSPTNADLCANPTIDAITRTEDGSSYVFKGDHYWLLTSDGLAKGYPRKITTDWDGLPGSIDAALTWADGKTFFFKGNKYWRYRNRRRDIGYPKLISAGFAGIPDDIDAAFVWSGNGRTYIFKGSEYWRFDSKADPPVSNEYPRSIKIWNGVPSHVNDAFKWENNVTYFFKGNQYYRFNDKEFRVESRGRPPFPRHSADWWFGCVSSNLASQRALPTGGYLKELNSNLEPSGQHDTLDWSYYADLDERTRIAGTHISDQASSTGPGPPPAVAGVWRPSSASSRAQVASSLPSLLSSAILASLTLELLARRRRL